MFDEAFFSFDCVLVQEGETILSPDSMVEGDTANLRIDRRLHVIGNERGHVCQVRQALVGFMKVGDAVSIPWR